MDTDLVREHDEAWANAIAAMPDGWFGPRIEPRWPNRWRAWIERMLTEPTMRVSAWGKTEAEALTNLTNLLPTGVESAERALAAEATVERITGAPV